MDAGRWCYYRDFFARFYGEDCPAVRFLDRKIAAQGRDEVVVTDESQMLHLLGSMIDPHMPPPKVE